MISESIRQRILHLHTVEKLSFRQIAHKVGLSRTTVGTIVNCAGKRVKQSNPMILDQYRSLIVQWYKDYPFLQAKQIYERLQSYGYRGSYPTVIRYTREFREKKKPAYHALEFVPGEEAQIDWITVTDLPFGKVYGFIFILSYSRYGWGKFYPRNSFEFFLEGHLECFRKINGIPHQCRYDNLKSVVITRDPYIKYNPQFLDFSRFHGFRIYLCNPYAAHEKGRVERLNRDIRGFIYNNTFEDLADLNRKFRLWLEKRNDTQHRITLKTPLRALAEEKLLPLPALPYQAGKIITATVSPTAFVEFDTNKYSVPTTCHSRKAELIVYPDKIVIMAGSSQVAVHKRCLARHQKIENPLHRERLLQQTPRFKYKRILQLMKNMHPAIASFIDRAHADGESETEYAYQLFKLIKLTSRNNLICCIQKASSVKSFKLKTVWSLLNLPVTKQASQVYPKDTNLLNIKYQQRRLEDYDQLI